MTDFLFAGLIVLIAVSLAGFALVVANFLGWTSWKARERSEAAPEPREPLLALLDRRLASGEISVEEYEREKNKILGKKKAA